MTNQFSQAAVCPLHQRHDIKHIHCIDIGKDRELRFTRMEDCMKQYEIFCTSHYKYCEVYRMMCMRQSNTPGDACAAKLSLSPSHIGIT